MDKIQSFKVDHTVLKEGLYVSRLDSYNDNTIITTYDIRMVKPNSDKIMTTSEIHTIEHLGATYLRNSSIKHDVVYFGPMGCRTGFYLLVQGEYNTVDVRDVLKDMFECVLNADDVPGCSAIECGNYKDMDLDGAKSRAFEYLYVLNSLDNENTSYKYIAE